MDENARPDPFEYTEADRADRQVAWREFWRGVRARIEARRAEAQPAVQETAATG